MSVFSQGDNGTNVLTVSITPFYKAVDKVAALTGSLQ
jgi:hypothetical protein